MNFYFYINIVHRYTNGYFSTTWSAPKEIGIPLRLIDIINDKLGIITPKKIGEWTRFVRIRKNST